jgi:hypothetical protein
MMEKQTEANAHGRQTGVEGINLDSFHFRNERHALMSAFL